MDWATSGGTGGATAGRSAQGRAVMATVLLAVLLVGGEALAQTETEPWSATLTRGDGVAASSGNYGYVAATETGPGGMLDPSTFTYAGVLYTVKRLYVTDLGPFDAVAFETSPALPNDAGLVLRVPTFKTDDVSEACPIVLEYQDFEIHSPDMSNPGLFSWPVSFTSCLTSENWAADLTTTGTVKLIKPPAVTLVLSDASIGENGGVSTVTATVSPASAAAFTVTVAAAAVAPAVAADFELSTNRVLSFAENATTSTGTVTITGVDNDVYAADKTVTVSGTVSATSVTAPANRTLTLEDDDLPTVGISNSRGDEHYVPGVAGVAIGPYVEMSAVSDKIVIVTWTASIESGDTAEEADFVDLSAVTGTVWLVPGWKVHAFNLPPVVFDDALDEEDETFTVTLSAVNAVVGQVNASVHSAGTMTIVDDDPTPTVTVGRRGGDRGRQGGVRGDAVGGERAGRDGGLRDVGGDRRRRHLGHGLHGGEQRHADHRGGRQYRHRDDRGPDDGGRRERERRDLHADDLEPG